MARQTTKFGDSSYCQKCGNKVDKLYEIPFDKSVKYSGSNRKRVSVVVTIKVCKECKKNERKRLPN